MKNEGEAERFYILAMLRKIWKMNGSWKLLDFTNVQKLWKMKEVDFD